MKVKELVQLLLDYPMDDDILIEVNGDQEYDIEGHTAYGISRQYAVLQINGVPIQED